MVKRHLDQIKKCFINSDQLKNPASENDHSEVSVFDPPIVYENENSQLGGDPQIVPYNKQGKPINKKNSKENQHCSHTSHTID